jgi:polyhydroxyalkanoate synthesis regulator protein
LDDSWEGVQSATLPELPEFTAVDVATLNSPASGAGKDINVKRALQALQANFSTLREHLSTQSALLTNNFEDVTNRLNVLSVESSSLGRRIGIPDGFGSEDAVTITFDGLRFLHVQIKTVTEPFSRVSFTSVVDKLGKVESDLALLNTVRDQDELENIKHQVMYQVAENKKQTGNTFEMLKTRFIGPMAKFYGEAMSVKGTIFERLGAVEAAVKETSDDGNLFRAISYMGGLTSNGEFGSPRQTQALEKRMAEIEHKNLELTTELETLKEHRASAVANKIDLAPQDAKVDGLLARLNLLEVQDGDAIRVGTYTFTNVVDCEAFLSAKVSSNVLSAYCYDMVLLVHRVSKNGDAVSTEQILQRDYTAHKGGFTHVGSAYIYSSIQQALPAPLAGSAVHPLPGVKVFKEWDGEDGVTGKRADVTAPLPTRCRPCFRC